MISTHPSAVSIRLVSKVPRLTGDTNKLSKMPTIDKLSDNPPSFYTLSVFCARRILARVRIGCRGRWRLGWATSSCNCSSPRSSFALFFGSIRFISSHYIPCGIMLGTRLREGQCVVTGSPMHNFTINELCYNGTRCMKMQ